MMEAEKRQDGIGEQSSKTICGESHGDMGGYFTLEAALVMPVVLGVLLFAINMMFYQYNRCVLDQRLGIALLRGCVNENKNGEALVARIRDEFSSLPAPEYIMGEAGELRVRTRMGGVEVMGEMEMRAIYSGGLPLGNRDWRASERMLGMRQNPAATLRALQRLLDNKADGGKE